MNSIKQPLAGLPVTAPLRTDRALEALAALLHRTQISTTDALPDVVAEAWSLLGLDVVMYLVDHEQRTLVPVLPTGAAPRPPVDVTATLPGRAFRLTHPVPVKEADAPRLWLPLLNGLERLGVLDVSLPAGTDSEDPQLSAALAPLVSLTGHMVTIKTLSGDALDRARETRARTVAAD